jgi:hypothetical protein
LSNTFTARRVPDSGLRQYTSYISIIADFMSGGRGEKLGKRMDKIVVENS